MRQVGGEGAFALEHGILALPVVVERVGDRQQFAVERGGGERGIVVGADGRRQLFELPGQAPGQDIAGEQGQQAEGEGGGDDRGEQAALARFAVLDIVGQDVAAAVVLAHRDMELAVADVDLVVADRQRGEMRRHLGHCAFRHAVGRDPVESHVRRVGEGGSRRLAPDAHAVVDLRRQFGVDELLLALVHRAEQRNRHGHDGEHGQRRQRDGDAQAHAGAPVNRR